MSEFPTLKKYRKSSSFNKGKNFCKLKKVLTKSFSDTAEVTLAISLNQDNYVTVKKSCYTASQEFTSLKHLF